MNEQVKSKVNLIEDLPRGQTLPFTEGQLKQVEADHVSLTAWVGDNAKET